MNLSIAIGSPLTPFLRKKHSESFQNFRHRSPEGREGGIRGGREESTENLFAFIQVRLPSLQVSRSLSAHSLQRGRWCVNGGGHVQ